MKFPLTWFRKTPYSVNLSAERGRRKENKPMPDKKSEPRILSGVLVLTFSNILVKLLGLFFKIPLHTFLGDQGMGYFNIAYNIFVTLYMVSTAGLPIAISILVSRSRTLGRKREVRRIFYSALSVFLLLGVIGTSIMIFGAAPLAELMGSPNSYHCIMTVAPTLFFICISSAIRGYFQGHQNMVPTATSEVIEAIGKFAIGIALGKYAISKGYSLEIAAAYAIAGIGIGVGVGMIYLTAAKILRGNDRKDDVSATFDETCSSRKSILRQLISIAVPITISAVALNLTGIIDSFTIINRMSAYVTTEEAEAAYGNYSTLAVTLTHLPSALITPIASALTPALAAAGASGQKERGQSIMNTAIKFAATISIPCAMGLSVLSKPILNLLFNRSGTKAASVASAAPLLSVLALSVFFTAMLSVSNSILQSHKLERKPIISMFCGAGVKLILNFILIGIPSVGVLGAPIGTLVSYFVMAAMNFYFVGKYLHLDLRVIRSFGKPILSTAMAAVITVVSYLFLSRHVSDSIATLSSILLTVIAYFFFLVITKTIRSQELRMLPRGDKIIRVLTKLHIMKEKIQ